MNGVEVGSISPRKCGGPKDGRKLGGGVVRIWRAKDRGWSHLQ